MDLSYAVALFDGVGVARMLGHLRVLLAGIVADPGRRLSRLPLLTEAERHRELAEWNDTSAIYPVRCLHHSFEQQAGRTPGAVAAVCGDQRWTYAQLNAHANQIARHLRGHGVAAETLAGIAMAPSPRRLAVLLGILKAGGGYVPLDPALPPARLAYMIDDTAMPVIVADTAAIPSLPPTTATIIDIDQRWPEITTAPTTNPHYPVTPANTVYVIYTSGSTGHPKGVILEHAPVVNYLTGMISQWPLGPGDAVLQFASLNFDVSVLDMFAALCSGATLVLAARDTLHSPPRLAALMRHHNVTFACLPPAIVSLLTGQHLPALRVLISAGEALTPDLARHWLRPGLRFCNGYGPTEAAIGATLIELDATTLPPPIGRPMPNYTAYVLDPHLNPQPVGVTGELHIGGPTLARGYLNQPELTSQRFIPDPYSTDPAARLYKTGDLVRRQPDGTIHFLGRTDNQVKIRGLRIEPGEIETALTTHPAITAAHVKVTDDPTGHKQLTGYATTNPAAPPTTPADLRRHLTQQLPAYMIPTHLLLLGTFPLTPNGKIDHNALPTPQTTTTPYTAPRTLIETLLTDLYTTLLHHPHTSIDDNFFDLGGNSLQAMALITRLRTDLAIDTGVTAIFLAPTPRQLAIALCEEHGLEDADLGEEGGAEGGDGPGLLPGEDAAMPLAPGDI